MKRDFNLVRRIMLDIQKIPPGSICDSLPYSDEYDKATIAEHVDLLIGEGFLKGDVHETWSGKIFLIKGLTWKGFDFIDLLKDESIWQKAAKTLFPATVSITFDLLFQWLKIEAGKKLGLP